MGKHLDENRIRVPMNFNRRFVESLGKHLPDEIPGFTSDVKNTIDRTKKTLIRAGELVGQIEQVRKANQNDPTQNDIAKKVNTYNYAKKKLGEIESLIAKPIQNGFGEPGDLANKIDAYVESQLSESAAKGEFAKEYRQHIRSLDKSERSKKVLKLISEGKQREARWVLGAGQELSGLTEASYQASKNSYKDKYHKPHMEAVKELRQLNERSYKGYTKAREIVDSLNTRQVQEASKQASNAQQAMSE